MEEIQQKVCCVFTPCITTAQNVPVLRLRDLVVIIVDAKAVRILMDQGQKLQHQKLVSRGNVIDMKPKLIHLKGEKLLGLWNKSQKM